MSKDKRLGRGLEAMLQKVAAANESFLGATSSDASSAGRNIPDNAYPSILTINQTEETSASIAAKRTRRSDAAELEAEKDRALAGFSDGRVATEIPVDQIEANPYQPRLDFDESELKELEESLKQHGMLQPIVLRQCNEHYEIVAGERRFRAAQEAKWEKVPAIVIQVEDRQMAELALTENMQRRDLNPLEKATAFRNYLDCYGGTHEELAARLALDRSTVTNLMRLLDLNEDVQQMTRQGELTQGHARALLPLEEWDQKEMAQRIVNEELSVRETEAIVKQFLESGKVEPRRPKTAPEVSPRIRELESQFRSWLGMKIKLTSNDKGKGKLVIQFNSNDDFERIYQALKPHDN